MSGSAGGKGAAENAGKPGAVGNGAATGGTPGGNGQGHDGGGAAGTSDTIFTRPAPEGSARKVSEVLGEIVWLMSQSPLHKQFFISDLEWLVMPPVLLGQFRMYYDTGDEKNAPKPVGVVLWAEVDVDVRLSAGGARLRPQDWRSADRLWAVEVLAPFGGAEAMVKELKANVFPARKVRYSVGTHLSKA